jgi:tetratricopeptide (TPR) repeat protein
MVWPWLSQGQVQLHSPAEALDIMRYSSVNYTISPLRATLKAPSLKVLDHGNFITYVEGKKVLRNYRDLESKTIAAQRNKAESLILSPDSDLADIKKACNEVLAEIPAHSVMATILGLCYQREADTTRATQWFQKAVEFNPIDYYAHWMLASQYARIGQDSLANWHYVKAHVLNRNNPRLDHEMQAQLKKQHNIRFDWSFSPAYRVINAIDGVRIDSEENWLSYAIYKALWQHEPNYAKTMAPEGDEYGIIEETECLLGLYAALSSDLTPPSSLTLEQERLIYSVEHDHLETFLFYEVILPQQPLAALFLEDVFIQDIYKYLLEVRRR